MKIFYETCQLKYLEIYFELNYTVKFGKLNSPCFDLDGQLTYVLNNVKCLGIVLSNKGKFLKMWEEHKWRLIKDLVVSLVSFTRRNSD